MRWKNTSTPTFAGSAGSAGKPSVVETMQLLDDAGNEVAVITKAVDGVKSMSVAGLGVPAIQSAVLTADFPKVNNTLTVVTGWSSTPTLEAGKTYRVTGQFVPSDGGNNGGGKADLNGGTATIIGMRGFSTSSLSPINITSLTDLFINTDSTETVGLDVTLQVNAGGTFIPRFAQQTTDAAASTLLKYSTYTVQEILPLPVYA